MDSVEDQKKFADKFNLNFALLCDTDKKVTRAFGAMHPEWGVSNRVTFILNKDGVVEKVYPKVDAKIHHNEVLEFIKTARSQ